MKTLKIFTLALFAMLVLSANSYSQNDTKQYKYTAEEKAKLIVDDLKPVLNLSNDQYTQLYNLYVQRINEVRSNKGGTIDKDTRKTKSKEFNNAVKAILSDQQWEDYKKYWKDKKSTNKKDGKKDNKRKKTETGTDDDLGLGF